MRSTAFIEARSMYRADGPEELCSVGEVEFVQGLAAASASGLYGPTRAAAAIIGNADLSLGEAVEPILEALQAASPNRYGTGDAHVSERPNGDNGLGALEFILRHLGLDVDPFTVAGVYPGKD